MYHQLGAHHLLLDVDVDHAVDVADGLLYAGAERVEPLQVGAKDLDGNLCLCTREHGVDAVGDGLADLDVGAGQLREPLAQLVGDLGAGASALEGVGHVELADVGAERVLGQLGTAGLAGYAGHLGHRHDDALGLGAEAVALLKGDARQGGDVDCKRAFVERRQERPSQREEYHHGAGKGHACGDEHRARVGQCPGQRARVGGAQLAAEPWLALHGRIGAPAASQQIVAEHRGEGEGDQGRRHQRHDKGHAQRYEQAALHARQEE